MADDELFIFIPPPCPESSEEDAELYTTWIEEDIAPQLEKHGIAYKSDADFGPGNRQQQQNDFLHKCTNLLIPVCPMVCSSTNLAWLSAHFSEAKPPIIIQPPKHIAGSMTLRNTGRLENFHPYNCKTEKPAQKAFEQIAKYLHGKKSACKSEDESGGKNKPDGEVFHNDTESRLSSDLELARSASSMSQSLNRHDSESSKGFEVEQESESVSSPSQTDKVTVPLRKFPSSECSTETASSECPSRHTGQTLSIHDSVSSSSCPSHHTGVTPSVSDSASTEWPSPHTPDCGKSKADVNCNDWATNSYTSQQDVRPKTFKGPAQPDKFPPTFEDNSIPLFREPDRIPTVIYQQSDRSESSWPSYHTEDIQGSLLSVPKRQHLSASNFRENSSTATVTTEDSEADGTRLESLRKPMKDRRNAVR